LGRFEQPDVDAFIEGIDCYLLALNISTKNQLSDKTSNEHTFSFKKCKGRYKNGKFIILAGSSFIDKYDSVIQSLDKHCKRYNGQMERLKMFQGEINNLILDQKARRNNNNIELIYD
jgi:hypothetical protein